MKTRQLQFAFVMALTLGRIPLILVFLAVNLFVRAPGSFWFSVAFYSMVLSALTDLFDGYFARRFNLVTKLGGYADPLTDKFFYLVAFPTLVFRAGLGGEPFAHVAVLVAFAVLFLVRDQWVSFLRSIGALHGVDGRANWSGKARTVVTFPALCCIYWYLQVPKSWWLQLAPWFIYFAEGLCVAINLISIWVYTRLYWPSLKREMQMPR